MQAFDLFPKFDDFPLEGIESHECIKLLLIHLSLNLANQAVHVFAEGVYLLI